MKTLILILLVMVTLPIYAQNPEQNQKEDPESRRKKIIALEKAALERWNNGDVQGFLEISADDIVYFDPMLEKRIDGLTNLTAYYKPIAGKIKVSRYEMIDPKVQAVDNMAVLTFNLKSYQGEQVMQWNSTEVYRKEKDGSWKIIQSHWSFTKPNLK